MDMMTHWGRCSLTANYLAGYVAPSFANSDSARVEISIILDELIENAVKFCADVEEPVVVTVDNFGRAVRLQVSNLCREHHAEDLGRSIARVLTHDPEELFVEQVEEAATEDELASRLGFITLSMNEAVRLGARISRSSREGFYTVTVQVVIDRDDLGPEVPHSEEAPEC
ncbi:MAG: hypothetical protein R3F61_32850 [Myxococcota bacterium]